MRCVTLLGAIEYMPKVRGVNPKIQVPLPVSNSPSDCQERQLRTQAEMYEKVCSSRCDRSLQKEVAMFAGAARGSVEGFQRIFLSWNYWDLEERAASNGGVNEELEDLPESFDSAEVKAISCRM